MSFPEQFDGEDVLTTRRRPWSYPACPNCVTPVLVTEHANQRRRYFRCQRCDEEFERPSLETDS